ncbi:MAG: ATP-binding cassette domain-containing protein [Bacillota bacterium]|jgi:cobalt transport protein ATP-binding subunit
MLLYTEQLDFAYPDGAPVLSNVNLQLQQGSFTALLGANGCGKTTLFKLLTGLLKPTGGKVCLDGRDLAGVPARELRRRVGFVFQDPNDQLFSPTVLQDVSCGPVNLGLGADDARRIALQCLGRVGMGEVAGRPVHHLSYGQKKRVAIAGILAMRPEILILDEPTAGLDPLGAGELMKLLRQLNTGEGITVLMATHDVDVAPVYCREIKVLSGGSIILDGPPAAVFQESGRVRQAGLRLPRITHLFEIACGNGKRADLPLTIGGGVKWLRKTCPYCATTPEVCFRLRG